MGGLFHSATIATVAEVTAVAATGAAAVVATATVARVVVKVKSQFADTIRKGIAKRATHANTNTLAVVVTAAARARASSQGKGLATLADAPRASPTEVEGARNRVADDANPRGGDRLATATNAEEEGASTPADAKAVEIPEGVGLTLLKPKAPVKATPMATHSQPKARVRVTEISLKDEPPITHATYFLMVNAPTATTASSNTVTMTNAPRSPMSHPQWIMT